MVEAPFENTADQELDSTSGAKSTKSSRCVDSSGMTADEVSRVVESAQPKDFLERWAASYGKKKTS